MPPALSDDDIGSQSSSGDEQIPAKTAPGKAKADPEDGGDDDVSESEDEFVVEKIVGHKTTKKGVLYDVKWQGYDDPADRTWEPRDNLNGAKDVLDEYHESIGGDPAASTKAGGAKRKERKSNAAESETSTPAAPNKRIKQEKPWEPPAGSWESDVNYVDTVEETPDPTSGKLVRYAYLVWQNGKKTQHPLNHVYTKCPHKMLEYYESHLVFSQGDPEPQHNGDEYIH
ncbi:hypothetical protein DM02DRAFT_618930 [Periconia macrospinosa]|uniref:Chromo domain-containing protein n=1 Tax=Periconia macrospinosa TaxID=97972 RepID=A0A2V1D7F7_9PLEO|nr:hypothetical protein DM02DRAFT_618930 [Periconia macrospinosa]